MSRLDGVIGEVRPAAQRLVRSRVVTLATVGSLAAVIAASVCLVSFIDGYLFPKINAPEPASLVRVSLFQDDKRLDLAPMPERVVDSVLTTAYRNLVDVSAIGRGFKPVILRGRSQLQSVEGVRGSYFHIVGARPIAGRLITEDDYASGRDAAVALSERLWRQEFNSDAGIIGARTWIDGQEATIVGIVASPFRGFFSGLGATDVWVSGQLQRPTRIVARLGPEVDFRTADAEFRERSEGLYTGASRERLALRPGVTSNAPAIALVSGATVVLLSLVVVAAAASSLAGLVSARLLGRRPELAIRQTLGAGRREIQRMFAVEAALIIAPAGVVGTLAAVVLGPFVAADLFGELRTPVRVELRFDWLTLIYVIVVTSLVWWALVRRLGVIATPDNALMTAGSQGTAGATAPLRQLSRGLLSLELCIATALVTLAAALVRTSIGSFEPSRQVDSSAAVAWMNAGTTERVQAAAVLLHELKRSSTSGLAGMGSGLPGSAQSDYVRYMPISTQVMYSARVRYVTEGYFAALGYTLLEGREFDSLDEGTAIVTEAVARDLTPNGYVVGSSVSVRFSDEKERRLRIVGVVAGADTRAESLDRSIYCLLDDMTSPRQLALVLRQEGSLDLIQRVVGEASRIGKLAISLERVGTLREEAAYESSVLRTVAKVIVGLASLVCLFVLVGLYGTMSHVVMMRRREFAIRRAIGATTATLCRLTAEETAKNAVRGCALGLMFAWVLALPMRRWGVEAFDLLAFVVVPIALCVMALAVVVCPVWLIARRPLTYRLLAGGD